VVVAVDVASLVSTLRAVNATLSELIVSGEGSSERTYSTAPGRLPAIQRLWLRGSTEVSKS